jgi:hypothetical protein
MKKLIVVLLFLLTLLTFIKTGLTQSESQNDDPKIYSNYKSNFRTTFFSDDFKDNHNNWEVNNDAAKLTINSGYLQILPYYVGLNFFKVFSSINYENDFEIEIKFDTPKTSCGGMYQLIGLIWGDINANKYYTLGAKLGTFYLLYNENSKCTVLRSYGLKGCNEQRNTKSKLTVRKVNNDYYFFLNSELVFIYGCKSLGKDIGFTTDVRTAMDAFYLKIDYFGSAETLAKNRELERMELLKKKEEDKRITAFMYEPISDEEFQKFEQENWQYIGISRNKFLSILYKLPQENRPEWSSDDVAAKRDKDGTSATWILRNDTVVECEFSFQDDIGNQGRFLNRHFILLRGSLEFGLIEFTGENNGFPIYVRLSEDRSHFYSFIRIKYSAINFPNDIHISTSKHPKTLKIF